MFLLPSTNGEFASLSNQQAWSGYSHLCSLKAQRALSVKCTLCPKASISQIVNLVFSVSTWQVLRTIKKKVFSTPTEQHATWRMGTAEIASKIALRKQSRASLGCLWGSEEEAGFIWPVSSLIPPVISVIGTRKCHCPQVSENTWSLWLLSCIFGVLALRL